LLRSGDVPRTGIREAASVMEAASRERKRCRASLATALHRFGEVVKSSQKLDRFFTDLFIGRGRGGWIWLDWV